MSLPQVSQLESQLGNIISGAFERATDSISNSFAQVTDRVTSSINEGIRAATGYQLMDMGDILTLGISNSFFDKIGDRFSSLFGRDKEERSRLENLVEEMKDETVEQLEGLNDRLDKVVKKWEWNDEKKEAFDDPVPEDPIPEPPETKFNASLFMAGLFKNLAKLAVKAVSVALIGAAITAGIVSGINDWKIGEQLGEQLGLNDNLGGIMNNIMGNAQEGLLQKFSRYGKYAIAGATLGAVGLLPGIIVGGLLGFALGAVIDGVAGLIGKDNILEFVDSMTDSFFSGLEFITGTDVKRLEERIAELSKGREHIGEQIFDKQKEIYDLEERISKARAEGKTVELQKLTDLHSTAVKDLAELTDRSQKYQDRINEMRVDIKEAYVGLWKKTQELADKAWNYITSIPLRYLDSMIEVFTDDNAFDNWSFDKDFKLEDSTAKRLYDAVSKSITDFISNTEADIKNWVLDIDKAFQDSTAKRIYDGAESFVKDFITNTVDEISKFFTETLPTKFDELVDSLQTELDNAFDGLQDIVDAVIDEISVRDFLPDALGGNEESIFDRVKKRLEEKDINDTKTSDVPSTMEDNLQKSPIAENTTKQDTTTEALREAVDNITNDNSVKTSTMNAPVVANTSVVNKNMSRAPNIPKNTDTTSRLMDLAGSGALIMP